MDKKLYDDGLAVRRAVLGKEYVDRALANADDFTRPLQDFVTEYCWGGVWTRPGLKRETRSMLNLAMISCLNRPHELKVHVAGALKNGVTREEIIGAITHLAFYAGWPPAMTALQIARKAFEEAGE